MVLDLHGGAWNGKDRFAEEPMDCARRQAPTSDVTNPQPNPMAAGVDRSGLGEGWHE
jgi:hypothetical protein